jgi:anaerobic selenocysteine-containing dehydrogenase
VSLGIGRRTFLGGAGLVAGAAAACRPRKDPYAVDKPAVPLPPNLRLGSETEVLSTCGLCASGCGIRVRVVEGRAVKIDGNPASPLNQGRLCGRGQAALELLYHPDRVPGPLRRAGARGEGRWQPLSWDEATAQLAGEIGKLRARGEPHRLALIDGEERGVTHALWARFMRAFGSPNHIGHGATGSGAMLRAMAAMLGRATLPGYDFARARWVLLVGTGALESSPQAMPLARAVAQGRRPRLVCAWPRLPPTAALVDDWLPLCPGGQADLLLALAHVLLREELADEDGLARARGFGGPDSGWRARIAADHAPEKVEARTGIAADVVTRLARNLAAHRPSLVAVDEATADDATAIAALVLNSLLGAIGRPGGVRVDQGPEAPGWGEPRLDATAKQGLAQPALDGRPANRPGVEASRILDMPEAFETGKPYAAAALLLHYSNPLWSKPGARWQKALAQVPFVVSFSPLLDESARFADLLLPDHTFLESWDVVDPGRGSRVLSLRQPVVRPLHDTLATGAVILKLAAGLGGRVAEAFPWRDYPEAVAAGFAEVTAGGGDVLAKLERDGVWGATDDDTATDEDGARGQVRILEVPGALPLPVPATGPADEFPFVLLPFRGPGYAEGGIRHLPWLGELPLTGRDPWRPCIAIAPVDARRLHLDDGDAVLVESPAGRAVMHVRVRRGVRAGVLGLPLGLDIGESSPMRLLASLVDERTGQWLACATRARIGRVA